MRSLSNTEIGTSHFETFTEWRYEQERRCSVCRQRCLHTMSYKWYIDDHKRMDFMCQSCATHKVVERDAENRLDRRFVWCG